MKEGGYGSCEEGWIIRKATSQHTSTCILTHSSTHGGGLGGGGEGGHLPDWKTLNRDIIILKSLKKMYLLLFLVQHCISF